MVVLNVLNEMMSPLPMPGGNAGALAGVRNKTHCNEDQLSLFFGWVGGWVAVDSPPYPGPEKTLRLENPLPPPGFKEKWLQGLGMFPLLECRGGGVRTTTYLPNVKGGHLRCMQTTR